MTSSLAIYVHSTILARLKDLLWLFSSVRPPTEAWHLPPPSPGSVKGQLTTRQEKGGGQITPTPVGVAGWEGKN